MEMSSIQVCPYCQMPLKLLHVQTINLHLEVCFRRKKPKQECPRGLDCVSCMVSHYERYSHNLLARKYCSNENVISLPIDSPVDKDVESRDFASNKRSLNNLKLSKAANKQLKTKRENNSCESKSKKLKHTEINSNNLSFNQDFILDSDSDSLATEDSEKWPALKQRRSDISPERTSTSTAANLSLDVSNTESQIAPTSRKQQSFLCDIVSCAGDFAETSINLSLSSQLDQSMDSCNATSTQVVKIKNENKQIKSLEKTNEFHQPEKSQNVQPCATALKNISSKSVFSSINYFSEKPIPRQGDIGSMLFGLKPLTAKNKKTPLKSEEVPKPKNHGSTWKRCPFYKKVGGTGIAVDAFNYGTVPGITTYILSHFHYDHYIGLTKKWEQDVYCSEVTGNLVENKLRLPAEKIKRLPMNKEIFIGNHTVTLLEANHCPGAVVMLFRLQNGQVVLHSGDFRADEDLCKNPVLCGLHINTLYLDTTYLDSTYSFPPQKDVVKFTQELVQKTVSQEPKTLFVTGTYCIGKEKIFLGMAKTLNCKIFVTRDKFRTMDCLENDELKSLLTLDAKESNLHVLPMKNLNMKSLLNHLKKFQKTFVQILAIKPTGWTHSKNTSSMEDIKPTGTGPVQICGVPYSEHSSFTELKAFVEKHKPDKIIPTVNVGRPESRQKMEKYLNEWKRKS